MTWIDFKYMVSLKIIIYLHSILPSSFLFFFQEEIRCDFKLLYGKTIERVCLNEYSLYLKTVLNLKKSIYFCLY